MAYTPPTHDSIDFVMASGYTPPVYDSIDFVMDEGAPPEPPETADDAVFFAFNF